MNNISLEKFPFIGLNVKNTYETTTEHSVSGARRSSVYVEELGYTALIKITLKGC